MSDLLRRHLIAIATATYADPAMPDLPQVHAEIATIRSWLCAPNLGDRSFRQSHAELADSPTRKQVRDALEDLAFEHPWTESDAAVVYVTGHGRRADVTHYLFFSDGNRDVPLTGMRTVDLIGFLAATGIEYLMVIIDACFAGEVAKDILQLDHQIRKDWIILASASKNEPAVAGALTSAIAEFIAELTSPGIGEKYGLNRYLQTGDFITAVRKKLEPQTLDWLYRGDYSSAHVCLPNPNYRQLLVDTEDMLRDLALPWTELRNYWEPRARGVVDSSEPGWLFTGRATLMAALIDAARGEPGTTVITGGPGTGKSAALARLVTLSDSRFRAHHAGRLTGIPAGLLPPVGAVDVAVLATGKMHHQVLAQICRAFEVPAPRTGQAEPTVDERMDAWQAWLARRADPVTIVIDALDEAADPQMLVGQVLARLDPDPDDRKIRLLVGVRSVSDADGSGRRPHANGSDHSLAGATAEALKARVIQVDHSPWWQQNEIADYADSVLRYTAASPYLTDPVASRRIAEEIGARAGKSFLVARIAADSLARRDAMMSADDPAWLDAIDHGVLGVFKDDLWHSLTSAEDRRRAVVLLRATAFAFGRGLPWRTIWPRVARAVDGTGREYGDSDISWLLRSRMGAYLITSQEDGTTGYRPFHEQLGNVLQDRWTELLTGPAGTPAPDAPPGVDDVATVHTRITGELLRIVDFEPTIECAELVPAYLRRYLFAHAKRGGAGIRHVPYAFLPYADATRIDEAVVRIGSDEHRLLSTLRQVAHLTDWHDPARNAAIIQLWAALNRIPLAGQVGGPWQVRWAVREPDHSVILGSHGRAVLAATVTTLADRSVVALTGGSDGLLRRWDLVTGAAIGHPMVGHTDSVTAVDTIEVDGRMVAVSASRDGTLRMWDVASGAGVGGELAGHSDVVHTVATARLPSGAPVAVSGGADGTIRVWDLGSGAQLGDPLSGHENGVLAIATTGSDGGKALAVSGGADRTVRVWDLTALAQRGAPLDGHGGFVSAVTTTTVRHPAHPDRGQAHPHRVILSGGWDSSVSMWDLGTGAHLGRVAEDIGGVEAVAAAILPGGRPAALTGGEEPVVRLLDLATGEQIGPTLTGHTGQILTVATHTVPDGRTMAITGADDGTVRRWEIGADHAGRDSGYPGWTEAVCTATLPDGTRIVVATTDDGSLHRWDLVNGTPLGDPITGPPSVTALAAITLPGNRPVAVAGYWDATVRLWDLVTGTPIGAPLAGHTGGITAVATATQPDGTPIAITTSWDTTIRLWNLTTATPIGPPLTGHTDGITAVTAATQPDGGTLVVTTGRDLTRRAWDPATQTELSRLPVDALVIAMATGIMPDGRVVVITSDERPVVEVSDPLTGTRVLPPLPTPDTVRVLAVPESDPSLVVMGGGACVAVAGIAGRSEEAS